MRQRPSAAWPELESDAAGRVLFNARVLSADGSELALHRAGSGEPLLLIHANGMSRAAWAPVLPLLELHHDVIAIDLPGHGESGPIAPHLAPAPPGLARAFAALLDRLGIERAHVAGNSLGGWTALELAKLGRAHSVCALSPAGLWETGPIKPMLRLALCYLLARRWWRLAPRVMGTRSLRALLLRYPIGRPERLPAQVASEIAADLGHANGFLPTLVATHSASFRGGREIDVPVTVVFGRLDRVVPSAARRRDLLPPHTRWVEPSLLGHVPMWDDPQTVAALILDTAATPTRSGSAEANR
jgi:pimeloyl-ACP methyl ester carboxylesterase